MTTWALRKRSWLNTAAVAFCLALGIGVGSATAWLLYLSLVRELPFRNPRDLAVIDGAMLPSPDVDTLEWFRAAPALAEVATVNHGTSNWTRGGETVDIAVAEVSPGFLRLLGAQPALGRGFAGDDAAVAIITSAFVSRLGASDTPLGTSLVIDARPYTVVGVMPPVFDFPAGVDVLLLADSSLPLSPIEEPTGSTYMIARLRPGATFRVAERQVVELERALESESGRGESVVTLVPLREHLAADHRPAMVALGLAAACLFLLTCWNAANIWLAHFAARHRDLAVRAALGASPARLVRDVLWTSGRVSLAAGLAGTVVALSLMPSVLAHAPAQLRQIPDSVALSVGFAVVTGLVTTLASLVSGLPAAVVASRVDLMSVLKLDHALGARMSGGVLQLNRLLLFLQLTATLSGLVVSAAVLKGLLGMLSVPPGFDLHNLGVLDVALSQHVRKTVTRDMSDRGRGEADYEPAIQFYERLMSGVRSLGGVDVALTTHLPYGGRPPGLTAASASGLGGATAPALVSVARVSPGYFRAMGIPLLAGRDFTRLDREDGPPVAIVNVELARRFWPSVSAVGASVDLSQSSRTIVGVVGGVRQGPGDGKTTLQAYIPYAQAGAEGEGPPARMSLVVRSLREAVDYQGVPTALRRADPESPAHPLTSMRAVVGEAEGHPRRRLWLMAILSAVGLALACAGTYGVMSHLVVEQTRDIATRRALGASARDILGHASRNVWGLLLGAMSLGGSVGVALQRLVTSTIHGIPPADPGMLAAAVAVLVVTVVAGSLVPAARATAVDPAVVLRRVT